jgi:hypothetical protein
MEGNGGKKGQEQGGSSLLEIVQEREVKGALSRRRGPNRRGKEENSKSSKEAGKRRGRGNRNRT